MLGLYFNIDHDVNLLYQGKQMKLKNEFNFLGIFYLEMII